jgi:predicted RNA binding protein YcfA (HicA-like mRNA interferase family)
MELIRALEKLGFVVRRRSGSHVILRHPVTKRMAVVPLHAAEVKRALLFGILKQSGISQEQFRHVL